jgi:hypothetical protein
MNVKLQVRGGGGQFRHWALEKYGITIKDISSLGITQSNLKRRLPSNLLPLKDPVYYQKYSKLDLNNLLAIDEEVIEEFLAKKKIPSIYYAVHLRRGDYLQFASKLISDEEVYESFSKLLTVLPLAPIMIISDSQIDTKLINRLSQINDQRVVAVDSNEADQYLSHDLLRRAKILVTSNSTFSLSAALLARESQLAFLPLEFYTGYREEPLNHLLNKLSKFSFLI